MNQCLCVLQIRVEVIFSGQAVTILIKSENKKIIKP